MKDLCPTILWHKKRLFLKIGFDESIVGYGHEDTFFGFEIQQHGFQVFHIDNTALHLNLDASDVFLEKNKQAIRNLIDLQKKNPGIETRLTRFYQQAHKIGFLNLLVNWYWKNEQKVISNLTSEKPNLYYFDLFKLAHFALGLKK